MEPRIACSTLTYSRESLSIAVDRLAALGFDRLDLGLFEGWTDLKPSALAADSTLINRIGRLLADNGVQVVALNVGLGWDDGGPDRAHFEAVLALAHELRTPVIALGAPEVGTSIAEAVDALAPLAELAAVEAVVITIEPHVGTVAEHPRTAIAIVEQVPGLGITLDPCHIVCGPAQGADLDLLFPFTKHVHVRDAVRAPSESQVPFGQGRVDFAAVLTSLETRGYEGWFSIEYIDYKTDADVGELALHAASSLAALIETRTTGANAPEPMSRRNRRV